MKIEITLTGRGVSRLDVKHGKEMEWEIRNPSGDRALEREVHRWMESYAAKKPNRLPALDLPPFPVFTRAVLERLQEIPFGQTLTYGELARELGNPDASRAVGSACGRNPILLLIPCHRVVAASGKLGGFTAGLPVKEWLLAHEGWHGNCT